MREGQPLPESGLLPCLSICQAIWQPIWQPIYRWPLVQ
jgi:hypothetical protein